MKLLRSNRTSASIPKIGLLTAALIAISGTTFAQNKLVAEKNAKVINAPKSVQIQGQVFIVQKNGQTVKLALTPITIFSASYVEKHFSQVSSADKDQWKKLSEDYVKIKSSWEAAQEQTDKAFKYERETYAIAMASTSKPNYGAVYDTYMKAFKVYDNLLPISSQLNSDLKSIENSLLTLRSWNHYRTGLTDALIRTKSDGDGNFELTLPAGQYVLLGFSSRQLVSATEVFEWRIRVDASNGNKKLMLSNDNMVDTNCQECILVPAAPTSD